MQRIVYAQRLQDRVIAGHADQPQADHQHAGNRPAAESHLERRLPPVVSGLRGAAVGAHRDVHADVARRAGQRRADGEAPGHRPAQAEANGKKQHRADHGDGLVLAV